MAMPPLLMGDQWQVTLHLFLNASDTVLLMGMRSRGPTQGNRKQLALLVLLSAAWKRGFGIGTVEYSWKVFCLRRRKIWKDVRVALSGMKGGVLGLWRQVWAKKGYCQGSLGSTTLLCPGEKEVRKVIHRECVLLLHWDLESHPQCSFRGRRTLLCYFSDSSAATSARCCQQALPGPGYSWASSQASVLEGLKERGFYLQMACMLY